MKMSRQSGTCWVRPSMSNKYAGVQTDTPWSIRSALKCLGVV